MIQFITDSSDEKEVINQVHKALAGGIRWVQLRMKDADSDAIRRVAAKTVPLCHRSGCTIVVDDHVELVDECGFDGVHIGKLDMDPFEARKILGNQRIIGYTVNNRCDALLARQLPIDYIGLGPLRHTGTKKNLAPVLGIDGVAELISIIDGLHPIVVIGGVTTSDIILVKMAGAAGVAVSEAIAHAEDITAAAAAFVDNDK